MDKQHFFTCSCVCQACVRFYFWTNKIENNNRQLNTRISLKQNHSRTIIKKTKQIKFKKKKRTQTTNRTLDTSQLAIFGCSICYCCVYSQCEVCEQCAIIILIACQSSPHICGKKAHKKKIYQRISDMRLVNCYMFKVHLSACVHSFNI